MPDPQPGEGQKLYDVSTAGINFADTHQIENSYLAAQELPLIPGAEFVGTPVDGGPRVVGLLGGGGYAEKVVAHDFLTWPVPDGVSDEQALAVVLQGATAWHLLRTSAHLAEGESVVVIAGAGGVGSLAVQLARRWGAGRVIATASSPEKRQLAEELGAHATVDPALADDDPKTFTGALREANGGRPVDIVLEMTGGNVFAGSLSALAPFGRLVTYGMAARQETPTGPARRPDAEEPRRHRLLAGPLHGPPADDGRRDERPAADGGRGRPEARRRRALPDVRRPRGAPGPARPPHHRQARPRPPPLGSRRKPLRRGGWSRTGS